jgi:hypothetical protein
MNSWARLVAVSLFLLIGLRLGIYGVRALVTGVAMANGRREYSRKKAPAMYWLAVTVQLALAVGTGVAVVLTLKKHPW